MTSLLDYAALSAYVYRNARGEQNLNPIPLNWEQLAYVPGGGLNGFTVGAYRSGNDIVIAFKGTDTALNSLVNAAGSVDDVTSDLALGAGLGSTQLFQAALFYEQIKADPRYQGCDITFTGHSLGGGLASIMSVWFNRRATTFDEAPFEASARNPVLMALVSAYLGLNGYTDSEFLNFIFNPAVTYVGRESQVENHFIKGEFLEIVRAAWPTVLGTDNPIVIGGGASLSGLTLHSINLAAALLIQDKLRTDTVALPNLLPAMFDETLYAKPLTGDERDFLTSILNDQIKVGYTNPNGLLTRFAADIEKLVVVGTVRSDALNKALIAAAIEDYYFMQGGFTKDFFQNVTGGIAFDLRDIGGIWNTTDAKSLNRLIAATQQFVGSAPVSSFLSSVQPNRWYIQAGTDALNVTDTGNDNVAMIGGAGSDGLVGGTGADLLVGYDGADLLQGNGGNDLLLGGWGDDTYVYTNGDGLDTILDVEGQNTLAVDGDILSGGAQFGDGRVHRSADGKHLYVETGGRMLIDGNLVIEQYATGGSFGLTLTGPSADPDLPTLTGNASDNFIGAAVYNRNPDYSQTAKATLPGSTTEVGELTGAATANILEGGAGSDILSGGADNDRLYADRRINVATAIANGKIVGSGSDAKGDWLAGGGGDDTLVGGAGKDVLSGGAGKDLLIAGAGDDDILGDTDYLATSFEWTVTDSNGVRLFNPVAGAQAPAGGAADVIYAGEGKDYVWAGVGNDVMFGEGGDDSLNGNEGNDILLGGAGADTLWGGIDHDYLDGGAGVDQIQGGEGDDILIGGTEVDTLFGDAGRDTYIFNRGDGRDTVIDTRADNNIFQFGVGISASDINLHLGSLLIDLGSGDEIHIADFDQNDVFNSSSIGMFQFADGTSLTIDELLAKGFDLDGTDGDDSIIGTNTTDRIDGRAGDDLIYGLDGNDTITGGTGTDAMNGGLGDDTYVFSAGDSATEDGTETGAAEELLDTGGTDTIRFAAGIDTQNLVLTDNLDGELVIDYSAPGQALDRLLIYHGLSGAVEKYEVGAGDTARTLSHTQFIGEFGNGIYSGTDAANHLHLTGGKTADSLFAATGQATVSGGRGDDTLTVFGTNNAIRYSVGDGTDRVTTSVAGGIGNVLKLSGSASAGSGQALTADDLSLRLGANRELVVQVGGDAADAILFATFDPDDAAAKAPFDHIEFDPSTGSGQTATTLSYADLLAKGFDIAGTAGDDLLTGTSVTDRIAGGAGNDILLGGAGDDVLPLQSRRRPGRDPGQPGAEQSRVRRRADDGGHDGYPVAGR